MQWAARRGDEAALLALLKAGASAQSPDANSGDTPLHVAAKARSAACIDVLLKYGAKVDAAGHREKTSMHIAAGYNCVEVLKRLHADGADADRPDNIGVRPIHSAATYGSLQAIEWLVLQAGAEIDGADYKGCTAMMWAVRFGRHHAVSLLHRLGANYLHRNARGQTLLHVVAMLANFETMDTLADLDLRGLDVNAQDISGWTAIDYFQDRSYKAPSLEERFYKLLEVIEIANQDVVVVVGTEDGQDGDDDWVTADEMRSGDDEDDFYDA